MKYTDLGNTLSFKYISEDPQKSCTILATYTKNKRDPQKYDLEIKLSKTVRINNLTKHFEHYVRKEPITADHTNIKNYASRVVDYAIEHGYLDKHINKFAAKMKREM